MASGNAKTAVAYLEAGLRGDNDAVASLLGASYTWIDHAQGVVADTTDELVRVAEEHSGWKDREFAIDRVMECADGTVFLLGTLSQTHMGIWRSVPPTGKRVSVEACIIVRFDREGRVIAEEGYQDDLTILKQLGVTDLTRVT